ncbi:MAG: elongation factor P [Candidatus Margulisbacteria bacterium]|nr:elongation factor P [Candidatus Margulisiibacteriota bacterium]
MIIIATQIREGMILSLDGALYRVTWMMHRTPGKGPASIQTRLKHVINDKNMERKFLSADRVEKADLESHQMQYLYDDGQGFVFMDTTDFEQVSIPKVLVGEHSKYLQNESNYNITYYNDQPVGVEMPTTVDLKVTSAPPEIRKATASSSLRPVTVENDIVIQAPGFIKEGDFIRVNIETGSYLERVKK